MADLTLFLKLTLTGGYITPDELDPVKVTLEDFDADLVRRTVNLENGVFETLSAGDVTTPRVWFLMNIHDTGNLKIGFGQVDILTLTPGLFNVVSSNLIPHASGDGGDSKLLYAVYA